MSLLRQFVSLLRETVAEWQHDGAASIAASLAYYTIFSLSPLLIVIALFLGLILDEATIQSSVIDSVRGAVGDSGAEMISEVIDNSQTSNSDVWGTVIWISVVVWGASGLFAQLQSALNKIWEVKPVPGRSPTVILKNRLFSFILVVIVGLTLFITMLVNTWLNRMLLSTDVPTLAYIVRPVQFLVTMAMTTVLIAAVFKILPDVIIHWRDLWAGAAFTAFLFYVGQFVVGQYLSRVDIGSVFGTAGSLTAILVWIYYSAQILLFGAEFTEVWARHYGEYIRPDFDATWINEANARREARRANVEFQEADIEDHKLTIFEEQRRRRNERVKGVVSRVRRVRPADESEQKPHPPTPSP